MSGEEGVDGKARGESGRRMWVGRPGEGVGGGCGWEEGKGVGRKMWEEDVSGEEGVGGDVSGEEGVGGDVSGEEGVGGRCRWEGRKEENVRGGLKWKREEVWE